MSIFDKRINYKPFEYPEVMDFVNRMNQTFWVHSEVDFTADIQDFKTNLTAVEKEVVKRSLLSISQVEVGVKNFWGDLYKHFPKPEINNLGSTFAESETRHSEAYSRLIEVLGYNEAFNKIYSIPVFKKKIDMIDDFMKTNDDIIWKLIFFVIVIENSSLFSQFANILSFTRFKGYLKNTSNIIAWTSIDEQTHANAGIYLINKLEEEGFINGTVKAEIREAVKTYIDYEEELLDWIYEKGELDFFTKKDMMNFMKHRVDDALIKMNVEKIYNISNEEYRAMLWFDEDVFSNELDDFFAKRPTAYTKHDKSISANDLF